MGGQGAAFTTVLGPVGLVVAGLAAAPMLCNHSVTPLNRIKNPSLPK